MDLVSPHVKLGPVTTDNQAVFVVVRKRITNYCVSFIGIVKKRSARIFLPHTVIQYGIPSSIIFIDYVRNYVYGIFMIVKLFV